MIRWFALWVFAFQSAALACDGSRPTIVPVVKDAAVIAIELEEIRLSNPFSLIVEVCEPVLVRELTIDATMPAHKHGMNYTPNVVATGDRIFQVDGMLFHMPGLWELQIKLDFSERVVTYTYPVELR